MIASLEELGLPPRPNITITTVDEETVRAVVYAERALCKRARELGIDVAEAHSGYAPYIDGLMKPMSQDDKQKFQRLMVDETLSDKDLDSALFGAAAAERQYQEALEKSKPPSTSRIFFAGVNVTILIGLAVFWALK